MAEDISSMVLGSILGGNNREGGGIAGMSGLGLLFVVVLFLFFFNNDRGRGDYNNMGPILANQEQMKTQMGLDSIGGSLSNIGNGICATNYQSALAMQGGFKDISTQLCQGFSASISNDDRNAWGISKEISSNGMAIIGAIKDLALTNERCCCSLKESISNSREAILSYLCNTRTQDLQTEVSDLKCEVNKNSIILDNTKQTAELLAAISALKKAA